jgi:hypothetical protein
MLEEHLRIGQFELQLGDELAADVVGDPGPGFVMHLAGDLLRDIHRLLRLLITCAGDRPRLWTRMYIA